MKILNKTMGNRPEKLAKGLLFYLFLKLIQINLIFSDNIYTLYTGCDEDMQLSS